MTPHGPNGSSWGGGGCPDSNMLSAYLDGKLDATERGRIEEHISRCEDCYFVVKETAILWGDGARSVDVGAEESSPPPRRSGRRGAGWFRGRVLVPLAATLLVGAGLLAWWREARPADPYLSAVRPLVDAVGERRFLEPRLIGGFRFGPLAGAKRGASPADSERWGILASAAEARARADRAPTPANLRALAAAELLMDETDAAVLRLEQLARDLPSDAGVKNDLAAAYMTRALRAGREDDWPRALESAETALHLDPDLIEARFNRAFALEAMSLWTEAAKAWRDYLEAASSAPDGWADEARRRLDALQRRPVSDLELRKEEIENALRTGDENEVTERVAAAPAAGLEVLEARLVDETLSDHDWTRQVSALRHALRASPARVGFADEPLRPEDRAELRAYGEARAHYRKLEWEQARRQLGAFATRRSTAVEPFPLFARAYVAAIDYQAGNLAQAEAALQELDAESAAGPLFLGRVAWVRGMIALRSGKHDLAALHYADAAARFVEANDPGDGSVMAVSAGELLERLGLAPQSWEQILTGLRNRGSGQRLRSSALLLRSAEIAEASGSPKASLAFAREAASLVGEGDPMGDRVVVERTLARILLHDDPEEALRRLSAARALAGREPDGILRTQLTRELDRLDAERQFAMKTPGFESTVTRVLDDLGAQGARGRQADLLTLRGRWRLRRGATVEGEADLTEALRIFETNAAPNDASRAAYHQAAWKAFEALIDARAAEKRPLEALALAERSLRFLRGSPDRSEVDGPVLQRVIDWLPVGRATLVLVPTTARLHAWILTRGRLAYTAVEVRSRDLEAEIDSYLHGLEGRGDLAALRASGGRLFEQLLRPGLTFVGDASEVDVVPHRFLTRVPFHALWDSRGNRYWGQAVSTLVSSSVRPSARPSPATWRGISILAVDEGAGAAALPGARSEGMAIAALYPASRLLIGNRVTPAALLEALRSSSVVHFAGHAQSSDAYPDLASLLVTDGHGGARPFLARSLSGLSLSGLSLVVLASCGSIQSSGTLDHGMMTVASHFLNAGAGGVLGSLWDVDDQDARAFMVRFHQALARSLDPVAALSTARSQSIEAGDDPRRWAAFALAMD